MTSTDIRRIAVLRANGLGDFVFALPALEALRAAFPAADLTLLGTPMHVELTRGRPGPIDEVVVVPAIEGLTANYTDAPAQDAFIEVMRAREFDLALQMHGGGRFSNPLVAALGARRTVGHCAPGAAPLDLVLPYVYSQPESLRLLELAGVAGAAPITLTPRLTVLERDRETARHLIGEIPYVVLHPGAGDPRRRWPARRFVEVGRKLAAGGLAVIVTGAASERDLAQAIAAEIRGAINVAGMSSLPALVGVLAAAEAVISNDSGPLHLARAVGAPAVGLFWGMNAVNAVAESTARFRPVIAWDNRCGVCNMDLARERCSHDQLSLLQSIGVPEVLDAVLDLLAWPRVPKEAEAASRGYTLTP